MKTRAKRFVSALLAGVLCLSLLAGCASKKKELTRYSTVFYDVFDTVTQVIAYCEASITITYNRPESEVRSIYSAQTQKSILDCVVDALDRQKTQFAIQISTSTLETDDVAALVRSACLNQPQLVVDFPSIDVTVYSGSSNSQKIFGITLQYSVSESAVNDRRTQLDGRVRTLTSALTTGEQETPLQAALVVMRACEQRISPVSTAYDALVNGSADSYGLAMAYKAVCDALNIPCQVVSGRFQGTDRCWNIVQVGGNYYHLDLSMQSETLWLRSDESMRSTYQWDAEGCPACAAQSFIWREGQKL